MTNALLRLASIAKGRGKKGGVMDVRGDEALAVIDDLVTDLSDARKGALVEVRPVSVSQMAALSISFEVVK
ncbi:MAG: hypothetical protein ABI417_00595 [Coleofasciculaceae cyanobacterium]